MKRERRSYDKEFKLMVVNLCHAGKSTKEAIPIWDTYHQKNLV